MPKAASSHLHTRLKLFPWSADPTDVYAAISHLQTLETSSSDFEKLFRLIGFASLLRENMARWEKDRTTTWLSSAIPVALMASLATLIEGEIVARYAILSGIPGAEAALTLVILQRLPHLTLLDTF